MGTYTLGLLPAVVPLKSLGATPTMVNDLPLITIDWPTMFGSLPNASSQKE